MFIDNALLNKIALWLTKQQDKATGAFVEDAPFYDYNMRVRRPGQDHFIYHLTDLPVKATGATQPIGKISLNKNYLISLGKYIIATDVKCYHTIFFSKLISSMSNRELKVAK